MSSVASLPGSSLLLPDEAREHGALLSQVAWFNRLRLIVAGGVIWLCALATHSFDLIDDPWPLYMLGAAIIGSTLGACYAVLARTVQQALMGL